MGPTDDQYEAAEREARQTAKQMTRASHGQGVFVGRLDAAPEPLRPMLYEIGRALDAHELGVCEHLELSPRMAFVPQWEANRALCSDCFTRELAAWQLSMEAHIASGRAMGCNCCGRPIFQVHSVYAPVSVWLVVALVCQDCAGVL